MILIIFKFLSKFIGKTFSSVIYTFLYIKVFQKKKSLSPEKKYNLYIYIIIIILWKAGIFLKS